MIYVVIPVHNRKNITRRCLASLQKQDTNHFTVIVVDDGSADGTSEMIRAEFPDTILLQGDGDLWWVGSINKGIRFALNQCDSEDHILSLNDDLIIKRNYISTLMNAAREYPNAIIGSVETTMDSPDTIKSGGILVNWNTAKRKVINKGRQLDEFPPGFLVQVDRLTGRGTLFPARVFKEVGLYDEVHFRQCADTELPVRANFKAGYPLFVIYDAVVESYPGDNKNINQRGTFTFSDIGEYFFGIRSNFNLKYHYWFARNVSPNPAWFIRYFVLDLIRTVGHFFVRFEVLNKNNISEQNTSQNL